MVCFFPSLDSKPPTRESRTPFRARTSTYPRLHTAGSERAETHDKRETSIPAPIHKYVIKVKSVTWLPSLQRTLLNRHEQGNSATRLCPVGHGTQLATPTRNHTLSLPGLHFLSPFYHESKISTYCEQWQVTHATENLSIAATRPVLVGLIGGYIYACSFHITPEM
jgi:hypothetical protein